MKQPFEKSDGSLTSGAVSPKVIVQSGIAITLGEKSRLADYFELAKVRLSLLVLVVTAAGFCLGVEGPFEFISLVNTILGTALVAFAANALNQYLERDYDRLMQRTADRPIPAGRMSSAEALAFGIASAVAGLVYLAMLVNLPAATLAAVSFLLYIAVYTPLKRRTSLNTLVGAVPGAIPPLIGYAAAHGELDVGAWVLFAILFSWQLPHFFAIAWMYREDYARGGYRMLSVVDPSAVGRQTIFFSVVLLAASLCPTIVRLSGSTYLFGAALLGAGFLFVAVRFAICRSQINARLMLWTSIVYLPILMMLMLLDRIG